MNIIVKPRDRNSCYCRPDTTWERENRDFYVPESVDELHMSPIVFARISKAGKCIGETFVDRYYDGFGFGLLMYCGDAQETAFSSCYDHTSILPHPLYNPVMLENEDNSFLLTADGSVSHEDNCSAPLKTLLQGAIRKASETVSLRIGDFVAAELTSPQPFALRSDSRKTLVKGVFCENEIIDFNIIF